MDLIQEKKYPGYDSYRGRAYLTSLQFTTLPIPFVMDWIASNVAAIAVSGVYNEGGKPLMVQIFRRNDFWTWTYFVKIYFYVPGAQAAPIPAIAIAVGVFVIKALLVALVLWIIGSILNTGKEIVWGPEDPSWINALLPLAIMVGAIAIGAGYLLGKTTEYKRASYELKKEAVQNA